MQGVCFYHAGCPDGFGAAWAVWRAWGTDARYVPRGHEDRLDLERLHGQVVVFVDIAPPNEDLRALADVASRIVVLDHHISARDHYASDPGVENCLAEGHHIHFDLEHSGAVLSWQYFHGRHPAPDLLLYVEDQDLWNWKLPRSEEVNAAIGSYPREFDVWDELAERSAQSLADEGLPILRANRLDAERALRGAHTVRVGERSFEAVNSLQHRSTIGHELAKRAAHGAPCGLVYRISGSRVDVSIYSTGDFDVSRIAAAYGGGGHRNAAGFSVPLRSWLESFVL